MKYGLMSIDNQTFIFSSYKAAAAFKAANRETFKGRKPYRF